MVLFCHVSATDAVGLSQIDHALSGWDPRAVMAIAFGCWVLIASTVRLVRRGLRDPVRWFPAHVRAAARARAGGRCEYVRLARRCRRPAQETDHFVPWARGGATSQANAVAVCRDHNQRKGVRVPSLLDAAGLWWRRRTYYPPGVPRWPGHRYRPLNCLTRRSTK